MKRKPQFPLNSGVTGFHREDGTFQCTGSQMGRHFDRLTAAHGKVTLRIRRVRLDSGGYDDGGAYWGTGTPLFQAYGTDGSGESVTLYRRAPDKKTAVEHLTAEIRRDTAVEFRGQIR